MRPGVRQALLDVTQLGHVVVDDGLEIVQEYRNNLRAQGQPGVGDAFFKWLWDNLYVKEICTHVQITKHSKRGYREFSIHAGLAAFDPSDRKFVALAAAHPEHPPILQAVDSKWWGAGMHSPNAESTWNFCVRLRSRASIRERRKRDEFRVRPVPAHPALGMARRGASSER